MSLEYWWNDTAKEKWSARRKTYTSATLSNISPARATHGLNPVLRGEKPVTNLQEGIIKYFKKKNHIYTFKFQNLTCAGTHPYVDGFHIADLW